MARAAEKGSPMTTTIWNTIPGTTRKARKATRKPATPAQLHGSTVYTVEYAPFGKQIIDPATGDIVMAPDPQWEQCGIFASNRRAEDYITTRSETDQVFRQGRWSGQVLVRKLVIQ